MGLGVLHSATPIIDRERCIKCGRCTEICPSAFLAMEGSEVVSKQRLFMGCIGCGHCMLVCPEECIQVQGQQLEATDVVPFPAAAKPTVQQLERLLLERRSVRKFGPRAVPDAVTKQILQAVATAPMGIPPSTVGVVVLHDPEQVQVFAAEAIGSFRRLLRFLNAPLFPLLRVFMKRSDYQIVKSFAVPLMQLLIKEWDEGRDALCYQAPLGFLFHTTPLADPADAAIATTYAMLAAEAAGLGSCWIGSVLALNQAKRFKTRYKIPVQNQIASLLVCGYSAVKFERSLRRRLASVEYA